MIEMTPRVQIQLSPDGMWYGTFRFKDLKGLTEGEAFLEHVKEKVEELDYELSEKIALVTDGDSWQMRITVKGFESLPKAKDAMEELQRSVKAYRPKGQKVLA